MCKDATKLHRSIQKVDLKCHGKRDGVRLKF